MTMLDVRPSAPDLSPLSTGVCTGAATVGAARLDPSSPGIVLGGLRSLWPVVIRLTLSRSSHALREHGARHLLEPRCVGAEDVVAVPFVVVRRVEDGRVDGPHDRAQPVVDLVARPLQAHAVLA